MFTFYYIPIMCVRDSWQSLYELFLLAILRCAWMCKTLDVIFHVNSYYHAIACNSIYRQYDTSIIMCVLYPETFHFCSGYLQRQAKLMLKK